ncbi:MAG TPA: chemotaxis protein CheW [Gammaproteobacteria bacterium]|nr:chemotaxis protein CheW [Gammaproteobacteria bacterium]
MSSLAQLRDQPFELLQEIERRSRLAAMGQSASGAVQSEWVGVGFRIGGHLFVTERQDVREVLLMPEVTRVPGAKAWLRGLANVRGQLLPIIDLSGFLGGTPTSQSRSIRVVSVNHGDIPAGLLVDEVRGFRRFTTDERSQEDPELAPGYTPFLDGSFQRGEEVWGILNLKELVESPPFLQAAN